MKNFFTILLACQLNLSCGQTHTFERQLQSFLFSLRVFKNPFDSSLYTLKKGEFGSITNLFDLAKTDTAGNIISTISFTGVNFDPSIKIIPFSNGFIAGGKQSPFSNVSNMARFDVSGNVIWAKCYSAPEEIHSYPAIVDEVNNLILSIANPNDVLSNNFPTYILKTDLNGGAVFSEHGYQLVSTTGTGLFPVDLVKLNSGNYLFVAEILFGSNSFGQVLLELDPTLNVVSAKRLLTSQGDPADVIKYIKKPDDGFYIVGNFLNTSPASGTHGFIINLSPTMTPLWAKYTSNTTGPFGLSFTDGELTPGGGLMIGGTYTSPSGNDDMLLMKIDSSGNLDWAKAIGNSSDDERLISLVYEPNDAIYLGGNGNDTAQSGSTVNGLFLKTDLSGNTTCGSTSLAIGFNTMNVTLNNEPVTITSWIVTDSVLPTLPFSGFTFVPSCDGIVSGIEQNNSPVADVTIFPNPASTEIQISSREFGIQTGDEIIFSDVAGKILFIKKIFNPTSDFRLLVSDFSNGIYFLEIKTKEGVLNKKVVVQH